MCVPREVVESKREERVVGLAKRRGHLVTIWTRFCCLAAAVAFFFVFLIAAGSIDGDLLRRLLVPLGGIGRKKVE